MAKAVKLADIAEQLGVSTVTVSKALSGQKGVSEAMREKIKQLADELGYKQPSAVKKEKSVKSYNIGVLVSEKYLESMHPFTGECIRALQQGPFRKNVSRCLRLFH